MQSPLPSANLTAPQLPFAPRVTAAFSLMAAIAYYLLQQAIIRAQGPDSILKRAVGRDWKGRLSPVLYVVAIVAARWAPWLSNAILVAAALIWLIPDRRIENVLPHPEVGLPAVRLISGARDPGDSFPCDVGAPQR